MLDVANVLARRASGVTIEPEMLGDYRAGDIRHCFGSIDRASELLAVLAGGRLRGGHARAQRLARRPDRGRPRRRGDRTLSAPVASPADGPVAVVVLSWNGREDTLACLRSLAEVERPD